MVSEHAMTLLLALSRQLPEAAATSGRIATRARRPTPSCGTLEDATVCVIGRGAIGRELVRKLQAFDARVIAVSRTIDEAGELDAVFPRERIREALAQADAVVICTAGDEDSLHMIGAAELAAMKPTAFIVNVARGEIVDEAALIAGAAAGPASPAPASTSTRSSRCRPTARSGTCRT